MLPCSDMDMGRLLTFSRCSAINPLSTFGTWEMAHNTYLEVFQGLGLLFGSMLVASIVLLALRCVKGAMTRQENETIPCVAAGVAVLVGVHSLVDFSLQIQAIGCDVYGLAGGGGSSIQEFSTDARGLEEKPTVEAGSSATSCRFSKASEKSVRLVCAQISVC